MWFHFFLSISASLLSQEPERERAIQSDPNAPIAAKTIDVIRSKLNAHQLDLVAICKASESSYERKYALDFASDDSRIYNEIWMLEDQIYAWSMMDETTRMKVMFYFEHTRSLIQDDLETTISRATKLAAAPHMSPRFVTETNQNKADFRKIRDWITAFSFKIDDPRYGQPQKR